jgi:hypothetical protein
MRDGGAYCQVSHANGGGVAESVASSKYPRHGRLQLITPRRQNVHRLPQGGRAYPRAMEGD